MAKHKSKSVREVVNPSASPFTSPAISVVIPLYNAEKYIGECLDSLLAQTFQNFEVIVVDDCSTDNSVAIVESYMTKFDGRLKFSCMKKNTGSAGFPRNKGIELARGDYIAFLDSDDTFTRTALEEICGAAKKFEADVVHFEKYYRVPEKFWYDIEFRRQLKPYSYQRGAFVTEPTLITNSVPQRVQMFQQGRFILDMCSKVVRRDFILSNEIKFCDIFGEDLLLALFMLCCAKNYVIAPNVFYNYRIREGSTMNSQRELPKRLHRQIKALTVGIRALDKFLNDSVVNSQYPDLKYALFNIFTQDMLKYLIDIYAQIPSHALDELLRKEFGNGDNMALMSLIFSIMNVQRLQLMNAQQRIATLEQELSRKQT